MIAIAKDAGFTITAGDLLRADAQAILELNDEELEKVAGAITAREFFRSALAPLRLIVPTREDWIKI